MPIGVKITTELKQTIVSFYKSRPMTIANVANEFGLSCPTIIKILDEYNVIRYKKARVYNPELIEDYFNNINSEEKAYYLGFIITDGNIFKEKNNRNHRQASISITQKTCDEYILQKFLNEIKATTAITHDGRGCSQVAVRSDIMAKSLEKYGIYENKTLHCYLPIINKNFMHHLIRGILDGDGNIKAFETDIRNRFAHSISFCGTHELMDDIGNYISKTLGIKKPKVYDYTDRHLSEIKWQSKDDMFKIGEWLYGDATIYLKRKYEKYLYFKNHYKY